MTAAQLKNAILQYAIQGKLVPQNSRDEPASVLLEKIRKDKQALVKAGKIKKDNSVKPITADEIPFEIPASWEWVRLEILSSVITKGTTPRGGNVIYKDHGIGFLRVENIGKDGEFILDSIKYIDEDTNIGALKRSILHEDDLLISIAGTLGRVTIVPKNALPLNINQAIAFLRLINKEIINLKYIKLALNSPNINKKLLEQTKTTAIPNLTLEIISDCIIPLPPLAEQRRIVSSIEELLPLVNEYDEAEQELTALDKEFYDKLKKSVLQYAIQGKLLPQNPNDEPASVLLEKIRKEKQTMIKAGKIKKEKPLPPITSEEIPFEIPAGWEWVRLGEIAWKIGDGLHGTPDFDVSGNYYFINGNNLNLSNYKICYYDSTKKINQLEYEKYCLELDDQSILLSINGTLGNIAFYNNEKIILGKSAAYINLLKNTNKEYIAIFFQSKAMWDYFQKKHTGTTIKNFSLEALRNCIIPLPPLAEQKQIVEKVGELIALLSI